MFPPALGRARPGERESLDQVLWTLYALGGEGTYGDVVSVTGLAGSQVERALDELVAAGRVHARVREPGDLTFHLGASIQGPLADFGHAPAERLRPRRRAALAQARRIIFDRRTLRLIRARAGVLGLAELMEQTGLPRREAESEMRRLVEAWGGEAHVGLDGHVVYAFPELMSSVHGHFDVREPRPAWVRAEDPMDHARDRHRRARVATAAAGLGVGALLAVPLLIAASAPLAGALGVTVASLSLLAAGARGLLRNHRRFRFRQRDTLRRYALGCVVETALRGKGVVSLDRTVRVLEARADGLSVSRAAVERALRELAEEFDAPITTQGKDVFFGFRNVKRQFLASHLVRRRLALGRTTQGTTVFDTADPPDVASARELSLFDLELAARAEDEGALAAGPPIPPPPPNPYI